MFFQHDGERVSILVEGRAHTQSVLAVVRMESSGRTLTALGRSFPSATVRALGRLSEAFRDAGRPPLSGEEEVLVLTEVTGEASTDASPESCAPPPMRSSTIPSSSGEYRAAQVSMPTQLLPPRMSDPSAAVQEAVVMEIEFSGLRVRVPERVNPHYVAALVAALAAR
jgi:hypothetical protein